MPNSGGRDCRDPKPTGGLGLGLTDLLVVMEGLGYGAKDQGVLFSLNAHLWTNTIPILQGTDAQKARCLPPLGDGTLIGANAASEPAPAQGAPPCARARSVMAIATS